MLAFNILSVAESPMRSGKNLKTTKGFTHRVKPFSFMSMFVCYPKRAVGGRTPDLKEKQAVAC